MGSIEPRSNYSKYCSWYYVIYAMLVKDINVNYFLRGEGGREGSRQLKIMKNQNINLI